MSIGKPIQLYTPVNESLLGSKVLHVSPIARGKWSVRADSSVRARRVLNTKEQAIIFARHLIEEGWTIIVHKSNGTIEVVYSSK